jgi:hypothetical protein
MVLETVLAWVTWTNVKAAVAGFILRHVSPSVIAKVKAAWAWVKSKF